MIYDQEQIDTRLIYHHCIGTPENEIKTDAGNVVTEYAHVVGIRTDVRKVVTEDGHIVAVNVMQ